MVKVNVEILLRFWFGLDFEMYILFRFLSEFRWGDYFYFCFYLIYMKKRVMKDDGVMDDDES